MTTAVNDGPANKKTRSNTLVWFLVAAFLVGLGAAVAIFLSDYEILEKGQLLPYTKGIIYKVRFHDMITLYLEPEEVSISDLLNAYIMTGIGFAALTFTIVTDSLAKDGNRERFWFFLLMFVGMSFLTADESLGLHESLGHNMQFLGQLPFVKHPDDAIVLSYGLPAAVYLLRFRAFIFASRRAVLFFSMAFISFLAAAMGDALSLPFEELIETAASVFIFAGVVSLGLHHTRTALRGTTR